LQDAGLAVTVFDKSRGVGGRLCTRRGEDWQADHGAQYFTARSPEFRALVAEWLEAGVVAEWRPQRAVFGPREPRRARRWCAMWACRACRPRPRRWRPG